MTHDRALLYADTRGNPFALPLLEMRGLDFYCARFKGLRLRTPRVAVAEYDGDGMLLYDVFGSGCPHERLSALARPDTKTCTLGFSPLSPEGFDVRPRREADTTLFVLGGRENPFERDRLMFPLLSHA